MSKQQKSILPVAGHSDSTFTYVDHDGTRRRVRKTGEPTLHFNPVQYVAVRSIGNDQYFGGIVLETELKAIGG